MEKMRRMTDILSLGFFFCIYLTMIDYYSLNSGASIFELLENQELIKACIMKAIMFEAFIVGQVAICALVLIIFGIIIWLIEIIIKAILIWKDGGFSDEEN